MICQQVSCAGTIHSTLLKFMKDQFTWHAKGGNLDLNVEAKVG